MRQSKVKQSNFLSHHSTAEVGLSRDSFSMECFKSLFAIPSIPGLHKAGIVPFWLGWTEMRMRTCSWIVGNEEVDLSGWVDK